MKKIVGIYSLLVSAAVASIITGCTSESDILHIIPTDKPAPSSISADLATEPNSDNVCETTTTLPETTTETTTVTTTTLPPQIYRGSVYDCNRTLITYSDIGEDESEIRKYNQQYKMAFSNIISDFSGGVDSVFEETLRIKNPTLVDEMDNIGQSLQLTIDADTQNALYSYMEENKLVGSVVVMRTDGSLMAEVSYPSYDPEKYADDADYQENLEWGSIGNKAFQNAAPGSCFKIMSEVVADKNGVNTLYDEGEWVIDGASIVNWDHDIGVYPIAERTLYSAFVNSSNIFFAKAFDQIGEETVGYDLDSIFHFISPIYCDFGPIENSFLINNPDDLRRSAFGQANVRTCPIYLAALGREAVFGDMITPFIIQSVVDTNDAMIDVFPGTAPYQFLGSIPSEYRQNLLDGMAGVGGNLGIYVPDGYGFYAKTGTAETGSDDILYITGILQKFGGNDGNVWSDYGQYNGSYIIVMQLQNPSEFGFNFASESGALYQGLINIVTG